MINLEQFDNIEIIENPELDILGVQLRILVISIMILTFCALILFTMPVLIAMTSLGCHWFLLFSLLSSTSNQKFAEVDSS